MTAYGTPLPIDRIQSYRIKHLSFDAAPSLMARRRRQVLLGSMGRTS